LIFAYLSSLDFAQLPISIINDSQYIINKTAINAKNGRQHTSAIILRYTRYPTTDVAGITNKLLKASFFTLQIFFIFISFIYQ